MMMPGRAGLFRRVELHRAVAASVSRDDELAAHVDVASGQLRVVVGQSVVRRTRPAPCTSPDAEYATKPGPSFRMFRVAIERATPARSREASRATGAMRSTAMLFACVREYA